MFPYTVRYNESDDDIQNNEYCTKYTYNAKRAFEFCNIFETNLKIKTKIICYLVFI